MAESELSVVIRLKDEASRQLQSFNKQFNAMLPSIKTASIAAVAMGGSIMAGIGVAVKAAEEQRKSQALLAVTLKNVGVSYLEVQKSLEGVIQTTMQKTAVSDEDQRNALTQLLIVTGNYKLSMDALPAVIDLAAAKSMSLESAATLVGRALMGDTEVLNRYGIELDKNASAQEVLNEIMKKVGGTAEATASPFEKIKNSLGELTEAIGTSVLPQLNALADKIIPIIDKVTDWVGAHDELVGSITIVLGVIGTILTALGTLGLAVVGMKTAIAGLSAVFGAGGLGGVLAWLVSNPIGWVILAILVVAGLAWLVIANWEKVGPVLKAMWADVANVFMWYVNKIISVWNELANFINGTIGQMNLPEWLFKPMPYITPMGGEDTKWLLPGGTLNSGGGATGWGNSTTTNYFDIAVNGFVGNDQDLAAEIKKLLALNSQQNAGLGVA